jgi:hypothetical protein
MHYQRLMRHGNLLSTRPKRDLFCSVKGCTNKHKGHNYCSLHLARYKKHGDPFIVLSRKCGLCTVDGCNRTSRSKGLCNMHRLRMKMHGSPGEASTRKGTGGTGCISKSTGYKYFYRPNHPNSSKNGQIAEHILVMCEMIGRPLRSGENVHHKNGIRTDNRPENLELWIKAQPVGCRISDMLKFCRNFIDQYKDIEDHIT